jgi:hypothetical protein
MLADPHSPAFFPRASRARGTSCTGRYVTDDLRADDLSDAGSGPMSSARPPIWSYAVLGLAILGVALAAWRPTPAGVWHDDGVYVMIGKSIAEGDGLRYTGVVDAPPAAKFPPLYPVLLSALWALTGGIGAVTLLAEMLNLAMTGAAGALFAWALHTQAGLKQRAALAAGLLAFVSADLLRFALIPLSEPLFLLLLMGSLVAWGSAVREKAPSGAPLGSLLVLLVLSRTAGAAAVAGFGAALFVRVGPRRALMVVAPAVVTMIAWGAWAAQRAREIPEGLADVLGPYSGWLMGQMLGAPAAFLGRLPSHAVDVAERVAVLVLPGLGGTVLWVAVIPLSAYALLGAIKLGRDFPPMVWIAAAYVLLLVVWPYTDRRLVSPLHPFIVGFIVVGAVEATRRIGRRQLRAAVVAGAVAWMGWYAISSAARIADGWPVSAYRIRSAALATALETLQTTAPPDAVVGAPELWPALYLHGGWSVIPSALFAPAAATDEGPIWGTPDQQLAVWRAAGLNHLILEQGGQIHGAALDALEAECPGAVNILARMPPQMLVRISWGTCGAAPPG